MVVESGARLVVRSGADEGTVWAQLEVLMRQRRGIVRLVNIPGPYIYLATRTRLRPILL